MAGSGNHPSRATRWHDLAAHLVQVHRANPDAIESYAPTLGQLEADHRSSHVGVSGNGIVFRHLSQPHAHAEPLPEGDRYRAAGSYAPFPASSCWQRADPWADTAPQPGRREIADLEPEAGQ